MATKLPYWEPHLIVPQCHSAPVEMTPKQPAELPSDPQGAGPLEGIILAVVVMAPGSSMFSKEVTLVWEILHSLLSEGPLLCTITPRESENEPISKMNDLRVFSWG